MTPSGQDCVGGSDSPKAADAFSPNPQPLRLTLRRGSAGASIVDQGVDLVNARIVPLGALKPWERRLAGCLQRPLIDLTGTKSPRAVYAPWGSTACCHSWGSILAVCWSRDRGRPSGSEPFYYEKITFKLTQVFIAGERGTNASSGIDKNPRHRART